MNALEQVTPETAARAAIVAGLRAAQIEREKIEIGIEQAIRDSVDAIQAADDEHENLRLAQDQARHANAAVEAARKRGDVLKIAAGAAHDARREFTALLAAFECGEMTASDAVDRAEVAVHRLHIKIGRI